MTAADDRTTSQDVPDWDALEWTRATDDPDPNAICIEIAEGKDDLVHIRQSDDPHHVVTTTQAKWHAFVLGVQNNEFDHFVEGWEDDEADAAPEADADQRDTPRP